jgi:uncharacterized membrane protein
MDWSLLVTLLHVLVAMVFVAGLVGRWVLLSRAEASDDVERAHLLADAATPFERMVVVGSMLVLPAGLLAGWARGYEWLGLGTSWVLVSTILYLTMVPPVPLILLPRGRRFDAAMSDARSTGQVTPELRAAFRDRAVSLARTYEISAVLLIIALMVLKPALW